MTKLERLRRAYKDARAEYDEVMQGGYHDETCRVFACMMTDAETELNRYLEYLACTRKTA